MQSIWAAGARVSLGQVIPEVILASETTMPVIVTLPVLVTVKVYGIVDPALAPLAVPAVLTMVSPGASAMGVFTASEPCTVAPPGELALTSPVLVRLPESTSAWVRTWVPVQLVVACGASPSTAAQPDKVAAESVMVTAASVTLPVLVAVRV